MSCFPVYFDFKKDREPMNDSFARDFPFPAPVSWETIDSRGSSQSIARTVTKKVATGAGCKYFLLPLRGNPPFRCFSFPDMIDLS